MAAQKGAALLLKIGDGGSPEAFTTVGGLRSTEISLADETVDVTSKDSSGNRTLLPDAGISSVSISGSGVFTDAASETTLKNQWSAASFSNYQVIVPDFGTYSGSFQLTALSYAGEHNGEVTYNVSLESSGAIAFTGA